MLGEAHFLPGGGQVCALRLPLCPDVHFLLYTQEPGSILPRFLPVPQPRLEEGPVVPEEPVSALRGQQAWHWEVGVSPSQLCPSPRLPVCLPLPKRESRDRLLAFPVELLRNLAPCMLDLGCREALFTLASSAHQEDLRVVHSPPEHCSLLLSGASAGPWSCPDSICPRQWLCGGGHTP